MMSIKLMVELSEKKRKDLQMIAHGPIVTEIIPMKRYVCIAYIQVRE